MNEDWHVPPPKNHLLQATLKKLEKRDTSLCRIAHQEQSMCDRNRQGHLHAQKVRPSSPIGQRTLLGRCLGLTVTCQWVRNPVCLFNTLVYSVMCRDLYPIHTHPIVSENIKSDIIVSRCTLRLEQQWFSQWFSECHPLPVFTSFGCCVQLFHIPMVLFSVFYAPNIPTSQYVRQQWCSVEVRIVNRVETKTGCQRHQVSF